jgi:hypothetical protein
LSIVGANIYEQLRLVGEIKLEKNGCFGIRIMTMLFVELKLLKSMGFKIKRMKVNQLYPLIGFEEETIEVDFVGTNDARVR